MTVAISNTYSRLPFETKTRIDEYGERVVDSTIDLTAPWPLRAWEDLPLLTRQKLENALAEVTVLGPLSTAEAIAVEHERKAERKESAMLRLKRLRGLAQLHGFATVRHEAEDVVELVRALEGGFAFRYFVTAMELAEAHDPEVLIGQAVNAYEAAIAKRNDKPVNVPRIRPRQPTDWWRGYPRS